MGTFRRIVTGHSADGRSIIASDRRVEFDAIPGLGGIVLGTLWGSDAAPVYPDGGGEPSHHAWFPPVGGMRKCRGCRITNSIDAFSESRPPGLWMQ